MPTLEDMKNGYLKLTAAGIPPTGENLVAEIGGTKNDVLRLRNEYEAGVRQQEASGDDFSPATKQIAFNLLRVVVREIEEQHSAALTVRRRELEMAETALRTSLRTLSEENAALLEQVRVLEKANLAVQNDLALTQERFLQSEGNRMHLERQLEDALAEPTPEAMESQPAHHWAPESVTDPFARRLEQLEATMSRFIAMIDGKRTAASPIQPLPDRKAEVAGYPKTDPRQLDLDDAIREHLRKEASGAVESLPTTADVSAQEHEPAFSESSADMPHEPPEEEHDRIDGDKHASAVGIGREHDEDHPRPESFDVDVSEDLPDFLQNSWDDPRQASARF